MKTDDIHLVMEALQTIAFNLNGDAMASRLYGLETPLNPMDADYIHGKLNRFHDRGIVSAFGALDNTNRRNFVRLVKEVIDGDAIPGVGRWE